MKIGRNDPCHCGSGKKYKHCCYSTDSVKHEEPVIEAEAAATDEGDEEQDEHHRAPHHHNSGRARFQGGSKPGTAGFRPNVSRGGQRGQ